jgi:hypothetical protein
MTSTEQERIERVTPVALYAVAQHMLDHQLPAPFAIDAARSDNSGVRVSVYSPDLDAWLDSIVVDEETTRPISRLREIVDYRGRLLASVGYVQVTVSCSRSIEQAMHSVSA